MLVGEWAHFLTVNADCSDQLIVLEHRHDNYGACTSELDEGASRRVAVDICLICSKVGDMQQSLCLSDAEKRVLRTGMNNRLTPTFFSKRRRRAIHRRHLECFIFIENKIAEFCLANSGRALEQDLENRLQFSR